MEKEKQKCETCYKIKPDVSYRSCAYQTDVNNDPDYRHYVCDDCEHEHAMDI